jgi:hypothetical protein
MGLVILALAAGQRPAHGQASKEWGTDFAHHTVPLDEIVQGGPPKDGIPPIDRPRFVTTAEADQWLSGREPVVVVSEGGETKVYPLQILIWHEIVNDAVGGRPVAVTYCPLCNTALVFDRRLDGRTLDFGTTGRLRHSDLVMYDRQSESWWQQATGEGIVGRYAGRQLQLLSAPLVSWREAKAGNPEASVLSRETGFDRPYGSNPYVRYDDPGGSPIASFFRRPADRRLAAMERVVAVSLARQDVAFAFSLLRSRRAVNDRVGDTPVVVFWAPGMASAVDARELARGRDVGATGVFDRRLDETTLEFTAGERGLFRDRQTGSQWTLTGEAVEGPMRGRRLVPIPHGNHFWFAWAAFKPRTRLVA